jgi:hypothetical protein
MTLDKSHEQSLVQGGHNSTGGFSMTTNQNNKTMAEIIAKREKHKNSVHLHHIPIFIPYNSKLKYNQMF